MLGIDAKTLRNWLRQANLEWAAHPKDARLKCLTREQVEQLATLHTRPLPSPLSSPLARAFAAPGRPGKCEAQFFEATILLPTSVSPEADLRKQLACLEKSVTSMQEHLAQLALELLQERSLRYEHRLSALEAQVRQQRDVPACGHEREALGEAPLPESLATTGRRLHPAELRARSRVIPLIEYGAADTYVVICPHEGALQLVPNSPEWFEWFATLSSFRFVGQQGRFTAYRDSKHGRPSPAPPAHHSPYIWPCLPPFPVICRPGATRCCTVLLCYACCVPMRLATHIDHLRPFPAPVDTAQGRCKERSMCRWGPRRSQALLLPGHYRASVVGTVPVPLRFLLSTLLLDMKHNATDRFMRDTIRCCHGTERFFLLHHTLHHCRPIQAGIPYVGCFGPGRRCLITRRILL